MTLDEAIKHAEEVMAENLEKTKGRNASDPIAINCFECAEEHRQLVEWLKDYKRLKKQEPCDVPDINDGNIYKCPCGYEWDKSKVVRHHFCPNCGRTVNSSYNSIKPELKSCEDAISRQAVLDAMYELCDTGETLKENPWRDNPHIDAVVDTIERLPSVNPRPQPKTGQWIEYDHGLDAKYYQCSICKGFDCGTKGKYCKWCGTKMVEPQESEVEE